MDNGSNTPSTTQQPENKGSERLFSQSEVDNIVKERLARERSKSAERVEDLTARETDLKAREEALAAKSKAFDEWTAKESCRKYLSDNGISQKLLERLDTSDPEAFKKAVQAVQSATNNGFTLHTVVTGAKVDQPPEWMIQHESNKSDLARQAFGLKG